MSVLNFYSEQLEKGKLKKHIIIGIICLMVLILFLFYFFNPNFRNFITIYIFRKQVSQDKLTSITLTEGESSFVYAYDKYITVLNKNVLYSYHASGDIASKNDVAISSPLYASNNKFLAIAENNGSAIYLISGSNIIWQSNIDGKIAGINVNNNGYISIIVTGTSYKSIVISFDAKGKELFKSYLFNTIAIDTDISNDNKYLSIAEVDYSGSVIKSMIKTISIEKTKSDPTNSVIYTFTSDNNDLITDIHYQNKNLLVCLYTNSINVLNINNESNSELLRFEKQYQFADIHLKNHTVVTDSKSSGFSNNTQVSIYNVQNNNSSTYKLDGGTKSLYAYNEKIAINTGSEIHFIGLNGWLLKKYKSSNEINNITLGDNIAGVVYKDKVEIIQF